MVRRVRRLLEGKARIERRTGEVLRGRHQHAQTSLGLRFGQIARLVDPGALSGDRLNHGRFSGGESGRVPTRQIV
jgi:hypothetical protein